MPISINSRTWLFILGCLCLAFLCGFFLINSSSVYYERGVVAGASSEKILPKRIKIPSIGIDANIKALGLTPQKDMEAPEGPDDTGWFELGPSPGEIGSAVIAGHRGWKMRPAVFDNLHKINIGDTIYVEDEKGNTRSFVVRKMNTYDENEKVPDVWSKNTGSYLNLITCSGNWNVLTGTSEKRLVVFTELII